MSYSGTVTYRITANAIINGALRLCGAIDPENTAGPTINQTANGLEALNLMVKSWETVGLELWERKYAVIFPQQGQEVYVLGSPGPAGDHACFSTPLGTGFINTTLAANAISGATTVTLTDVSTTGTVGVPSINVTTADNIGIQLASGVMFWTTVVSVNLGTKVVTLTTGLSGAATAGACVNDYTTKLIRPLRILDGFVRQSQGGNDVPIMKIPRELYNRFGVKSSQGTSIQMYYDPQENAGNLYVYPTTQDVSNLIYIEMQNPIQDFASASNDYDMPQEWGEALKYNLAMRIAPEYSVPTQRYNQIKELAMSTFAQLDSWDQEDASVFMQPDQWSYANNGSANG